MDETAEALCTHTRETTMHATSRNLDTRPNAVNLTAGQDINTRYELQQAQARLEDAARHLQRAADAARPVLGTAFAIALSDVEYARDRVVRMLKHLTALEGGR